MFWVWGIYNLFNSGIIVALAQRLPEGKYDTLLIGVGFFAVVALSYLLGSVNFALVLSRGVYHDDIRKHGSGNAGATNMVRTYGKRAGLLTYLLDGLKGVVSILFACAVFGGLAPIQLITAAYLAAFCAMLGHVFPCFAHFHGGKGVATFSMCVILLNPVIALILCFVFFPLVLGSHYVSLGSVMSALMFPILLGSFDTAFSHYGVNVLFAFLMGMLVVWSHRANIKRLLNGTESKTYLRKKHDGDKK